MADWDNISVFKKLLPITGSVFIAYLIIGLAMPILPLYINKSLGLGTFMVGLIVGCQFGASLLTRMGAGQYSDSRGAKKAVIVGLLVAILAGILYWLSVLFTTKPAISVIILLMGRAVLGAAESFIVTGALSWGMALVGTQNTGKVMSFIGTALYAAFAIGAPVGSFLYTEYGFAAIALATSLIPMLTLLMIAKFPAVETKPHIQANFRQVIRAVWIPGMALALSGVGFGAITTFIALLFAAHGWGYGWMALTGLSVAFIVGRLCFGHLPDKVGGARVALVCIFIEAVGQALIWLAHYPLWALVGSIITGLGYSLVYPGLGVEAIRNAPPQSRGLAMGAYTAFLDVTLGFAGPVLGLIASWSNLGTVYLVSTLLVLSSTAVTMRLIAKSTQKRILEEVVP